MYTKAERPVTMRIQAGGSMSSASVSCGYHQFEFTKKVLEACEMSTSRVGSRSLISDVIVNTVKITMKKTSIGRSRRARVSAAMKGHRIALPPPSPPS